MKHTAVALAATLALSTSAIASPTWRGLTVQPEQRCAPYDQADYLYSQHVESEIVARLGGVYSPYTCERFDSTADTDIEHIVARSEAHDSGLCGADAETKRRFAGDLRNLTLAAPALNRGDKGAHDAAEWMPDHNRCWFAQTVVDVRLAYNLTVDQREAAALEAVLADCPPGASLGCEGQTPAMTADDEPAPPPVRAFKNCTELRGAGWNRGVNRNGGTYRESWNDAEEETYSLNTKSDRDKDGHACE